MSRRISRERIKKLTLLSGEKNYVGVKLWFTGKRGEENGFSMA